MAIGFIRFEVVTRTDGKNACAKAAYNSRSRIEFEGNEFTPEKTYDWSKKDKPIFHEIILPSGVDDRFKSVEILWKAVEEKEIRKNSQLAYDVVLALPDDDCISIEDKIYLAKSFVQKQFIDKGLAAQIDIHKPDISKDGTNGHNWHAHILVTTRRFTQDGKELGEKARDLLPIIRSGKFISGSNWEKAWTEHQNQYFEEKGIALKVDPKGVVPQIHLGPVRMRARAFSLIEENANLIALNESESKDPQKILDLITETRSVFSSEELERFLSKHVEPSMIPEVRKNFWSQNEIEELVDKKTEKDIGKYTTKKICEEENQIIRLADRINSKESLKADKEHAIKTHTEKLNAEQKRAFENILSGKRLSLIEGHAGVGKSYLLAALKNAYEAKGYHVRAFGPDNATAEILREKGFSNSENTYRFLFSHNRGQRVVSSKNEIWIIDEAGKMGNRPLLEMIRLAEKYHVQLILSGCSAQMASVERGAMFRVLSESYGAQHLEDIQRQKCAHQRDIARRLAKGSMSAALDGIVQADGLKWSSNKQESIEELVKKWASDRLTSPVGSDLIIAHTNSEVRVLNEVVRLSLKEKGEISDKEFQCDTSHGKIFISVGDKLEFRKNDSELGVTNHMRGVLVRASEDKFVVAVTSNGKTREVAFNPSTYSHFQLGYATTFYSAQGTTIDRAYILLSPYMNKEMFYVGLTRHVKQVNLFVSKTDYKSLSDLKRQAYKSSVKETTLSFSTKQQLEKEKSNQIKMGQIEELKSSESLFSKAKGYGLSAVAGLQSAVEGVVVKYKDRIPDKKFYKPNFSDDSSDAKRVFEVKKDELIDLHNIKEHSAEQKVAVNSINKAAGNDNKKEFNALTEDAKQLLKDYQKSWQYASSLKGGISKQAEKSGSYRDWQEACAKRNELAFDVMQSVPKDKLKHILGNESFEIIYERSLRHESIAKRNQISHSTIEESLKSNIESLAYALFPDGPTRKDRTGFRFGTKGSLAVACRGENKGCYHDFENGQGGGPLSLIQKVLGIDYSEAKEWAKNFLGYAKDLPSITRFTQTKTAHEKHDEWVNLKPPANIPAPSLKEISAKLDSEYTEAARYTYTNEKGELLFHTLRLVEKEKPSSKIFLPLSYGHWNEDSQNPKWWVKGYQASEGRPLYNLVELTNNKTATVLIVEGEKTAESAKKMFEKDNIVCITWASGAGAVSKNEWSPLYDRKVIIWPDNDQAGYKASEELCSVLRQVGVKSLEVVDKNILSKELSEKWDLADPLPAGKHKQFIRDTLLRAKEKMVNFDHFLLSIESKNKALTPIEKIQAKDILCYVEGRLRPLLEQKEMNSMEIKNQIIGEAQKIYLNRKEIEKKLLENGTSGDLCKRLAYHSMMFQASTGKPPGQCTLDEMKLSMVNLCKMQDQLAVDVSKANIPKDYIQQAFEKKLSELFLSNQFYQKELIEADFSAIKNDALEIALQVSKNMSIQNADKQILPNERIQSMEREFK